jgi:hypothetical protein
MEIPSRIYIPANQPSNNINQPINTRILPSLTILPFLISANEFGVEKQDVGITESGPTDDPQSRYPDPDDLLSGSNNAYNIPAIQSAQSQTTDNFTAPVVNMTSFTAPVQPFITRPVHPMLSVLTSRTYSAPYQITPSHDYYSDRFALSPCEENIGLWAPNYYSDRLALSPKLPPKRPRRFVPPPARTDNKGEENSNGPTVLSPIVEDIEQLAPTRGRKVAKTQEAASEPPVFCKCAKRQVKKNRSRQTLPYNY